jgi:O-Antigen ligase
VSGRLAVAAPDSGLSCAVTPHRGAVSRTRAAVTAALRPGSEFRTRLDRASPFQRTGLLLVVSLALAPFWPVPVVSSLTVGRGLLLLVATSAAIDVVGARFRVLSVPRAAGVLFAGLAALLAWTGASALSRGCFCYGGFPGLAEWSLWASLVAIVAILAPDYRLLLLGSSVAGVILGGLLAALGVGDLAASVADTSVGSDRLGGIYGNSNFLAYAVAFAVPVLIAGTFQSGWKARVPLLLALVGVSTVIVLTFSRGGALAALLGALAVVIAVPRSWRLRAAIGSGAVVLLAGLITVVYPYYADERLQGSPALPDASGWDPSAQGVVPQGGSELSNEETGNVLQVSTSQQGQGLSIPIGAAKPTRAYTVAFDARTAGTKAQLEYGLEDNFEGNGPALDSRRVDGNWQRLRLRWVPTADSPAARFYAWSNSGSVDLFLRDVELVTRSGDGPVETRRISTSLLGPRSEDSLTNREDRYIDSRWAGVELGAQAFWSDPLFGIGWERFPPYAAERRDFGEMPTHNEYVRFAAELGAPGVLLLLLIAAAAGYGVGHLPRGPLRWGTLGVLVVGAVGLLFANALVFSAASAPLAVGVGLACSSTSRQGRLGRSPPGNVEEDRSDSDAQDPRRRPAGDRA